jgi:hypothetical protein
MEDLFEIEKIINIQGSPSNPVYSFYNTYITAERVYVPDSLGHIINIYNSDGRFISTLGTCEGSQRGAFKMPYSLLVDKDGFLYVNDRGNNRIQIFDPSLSFYKEILINSKNPIESIMLTNKSNVIVVAVAPTFPCERKARCLMREYDNKGDFIKSFGFFNQYFITYSWATAIDEKDNIYICNVFERTIYIYDSSRDLLKRINLSSPTFLALKTKVSRRPKTLSDYISKSKAFSQEVHTRIARLYVKDDSIFVLHILSGGKIKSPEYFLDIFDLKGNLLFYGIKIPGEITCLSDKFYYIENTTESEYGSAKITGLSLKANFRSNQTTEIVGVIYSAS